MDTQIEKNCILKLPREALHYFYASGVILGCLMILLGYFLWHAKGGTCSPTPCNTDFNKHVISFILYILGIVSLALPYARYSNTSYEVTDTNITINSGIVMKDSVSIDFKKLQSIDVLSGPLQAIFGVSSLRIWTASAVQNRNNKVRPTGLLVLRQEDASALKTFINTKQ